MKVPRVDLTDPSVEPTDAELEALMQSVIEKVMDRQTRAEERFFANVDRMVAEAVQNATDGAVSGREPTGHDREFGM